MAVKCVHHWVLDSDHAVRQEKARPFTIGRLGTCKKCGAERVHAERTWISDAAFGDKGRSE